MSLFVNNNPPVLTPQQIESGFEKIYSALSLDQVPNQDKGEPYSDFRGRIINVINDKLSNYATWHDFFYTVDPSSGSLYDAIFNNPSYSRNSENVADEYIKSFVNYVIQKKGSTRVAYPTFKSATEGLGLANALQKQALKIQTVLTNRPICELDLTQLPEQDIHLGFFETLSNNKALEETGSANYLNILTRLKFYDKDNKQNLLNDFLKDPKNYIKRNAGFIDQVPFLTNTYGKGCFKLPKELVDAVNKVEYFMNNGTPPQDLIDNGKISITDIPIVYIIVAGKPSFLTGIHVVIAIVLNNIRYSFGLGYDASVQSSDVREKSNQKYIDGVSFLTSILHSVGMYESAEKLPVLKRLSVYTSDYLLDEDLSNSVRGVTIASHQLLEKIQTIFLDKIIGANINNSVGATPSLLLSIDPNEKTYCQMTGRLFSGVPALNCSSLPEHLDLGSASVLLTDIPDNTQQSRALIEKELILIGEIIEKNDFTPPEMLNVLKFLKSRDKYALSQTSSLFNRVTQPLTSVAFNAISSKIWGPIIESARGTPYTMREVINPEEEDEEEGRFSNVHSRDNPKRKKTGWGGSKKGRKNKNKRTIKKRYARGRTTKKTVRKSQKKRI